MGQDTPLVPSELGSPVLEPNLDSSLAEVSTLGQFLPDEGVRVVGPLEDLLQRRQLHRGEGGSVSPGFLLSSLCVLFVTLVCVCWRRR